MNYCSCCPKKLHLFILLYQVKGNCKLGPITILEQFVKEQYAKKTIMARTGTFSHYLYSNKISEVTETTEGYSTNVVSSSYAEKEVPNETEHHKVTEVEITDEQQIDEHDSASEEDDNLLPTSTSNVSSLDKGSLGGWWFVDIRSINQD